MRAITCEAFACFAKSLRKVELQQGTTLAVAGTTTSVVYFPETAIASTVAIHADGSFVDVGLAGHEGLVGWPILLSEEHSPFDVVVHTSGSVLQMDAGEFIEACRSHPDAAATFLRYVTAFTVQIGRTAVSNLRDPVERRLSRWLLMFHDRLEGDEIDLTHKTIASMLGIRRASVTDGLHRLEGHNVIRNRRGRIVIRDRAQLRHMAGDGYGQAEAHYSRSIAPFGK
ncbi:MAG TPA: Crp/Fnr family transcriptional regulator [Sphingomonadaceae bacterium]|nr:Crp/Fnr family transcriptional regulator [Sphingomonadaceae bacterium]